MAITKTDSGDYILDDEILLENEELKQLAIDEFDNIEEIETETEAENETEETNVVKTDDKAIRRRCFELMEIAAQIYLQDSDKKGYELEKLKKPLSGRTKGLNYLEATVYLCAIMARYKKLNGFLSQDKNEPNNRQEVEAKIKRLRKLIVYFLDKIEEMEEELYGIANDRKDLANKILDTDSRTAIKRKLKKDFVNNNEVWLI